MNQELLEIGKQTIRELETEEGILASDRTEIYGCIFGRDSLITSLKLLRAYERTGDDYYLSLVKKILRTLSHLQGTEVNIESGEEPGKIIHEYRREGHEHLTRTAVRPWFVYPDLTMKNYDSVDSTPLFLIALAKYRALSRDEEFVGELMPAINAALSWIMKTMENDDHNLVSYRFHPERKGGGLVTQSWMDSHDSIFHEDGTPTPYPIAPAEVQAYTYLALKLWDKDFLANDLKERFQRYFVFDEKEFAVAFAIDGEGRPLMSQRSSMGHILWASHDCDSILDGRHIGKLVERVMMPDLFEKKAGFRTLSKLSRRFDPGSYHNGSIWPHDTAMIAEGLDNFGFAHEAAEVRASLCYAWQHFKTPIELFTYTEDGYGEYKSEFGQGACKKQAWSAASILSEM